MTSLIVPSGLLSVESDEAKEHLEEVLVAQMSAACAEKIQNRRDELIRASGLVDFHPEGFRVVQGSAGSSRPARATTARGSTLRSCTPRARSSGTRASASAARSPPNGR